MKVSGFIPLTYLDDFNLTDYSDYCLCILKNAEPSKYNRCEIKDKVIFWAEFNQAEWKKLQQINWFLERFSTFNEWSIPDE